MTDDRYIREVDSCGSDSTSWIINATPTGAKVLDVGCGPGMIGEYLVSHKDCIVDGVELSEEFCQRARAAYRKVEQADLESVDLVTLLDGAVYDRIICADVLEHLRNPLALLKQLGALLKADGQILISIPNISYAGLIAELLHGRFDYRPNGLLDDTHVRFFTRETLIELLNEAGLKISVLEGVTMNLEDSEFGIDRMHVFAPSLFNMLLQRPDALTYQFAVACAPGSTEKNVSFGHSDIQVKSFETAEQFSESLLALKQQLFSLENRILKKDAKIGELETAVQAQNAEVEKRGVELERKRRDLATLRSEAEAMSLALESTKRELVLKEEQLKAQALKIQELEHNVDAQGSSPVSKLTRTIRNLTKSD